MTWSDPLVGVLARWEKSWGYIGVKAKKWLGLFPSAGVRFVLHVGSQKLFDRRVDEYGRVFVGKTSLREFREGEGLICYKDTKGEYHVDRAKPSEMASSGEDGAPFGSDCSGW
jgi:hypothetical protein